MDEKPRRRWWQLAALVTSAVLAVFGWSMVIADSPGPRDLYLLGPVLFGIVAMMEFFWWRRG